MKNQLSFMKSKPEKPLNILIETEKLITSPDKISRDQWLNWLDTTRRTEFLQSLETQENRIRWTELVFKIIQHTNYNLADMLKQRTDEHPDRVLFQDMAGARPVKWTYRQSQTFIEQIATFFYSQDPEPRVAMFMGNSIEGASVDLACLAYGIFDAPLNVHFNKEIILYIVDCLAVNFVMADSEAQLKILVDVRNECKKPFKIIVPEPKLDKNNRADFYLNIETKKIATATTEAVLSKIKPKPVNMVATTMFTSGSTGMPKGVSFSVYNIVSKRFARAAALPQVGANETFICYLPLFHTFGRFLELTGALYWGGTYVFAGNPSADTLLSLFPQINPSGFISVPVRWVQIYEKCLLKTQDIVDEDEKKKVVRKIIGKNLHWGLSAAGFLEPKIFRFFQRNGVALNSGFGMTEATGGITMTPSWEYSENSVGQALPGMKTYLKDSGELEISGHYLARYLEDAGPGDLIPFPHQDNYRLSTGDIFEIDEKGHHQIIDRVKDIYKNNKGQTVAPGVVEKKFSGVPGIKRTFLVGDGKPYNVLLIVPDETDAVFSSSGSSFIPQEYFHQIVMSANTDLAPYERIVNFTVTERDFSAEKGELTAKGSFKRKQIEKNYADLIEELYRSNYIFIDINGISVRIPRWFYRDLGILERDITANNSGLYNAQTHQTLKICRIDDATYRIGDLVYRISSKEVDLGRFVRQPKLWVGNPSLVKFSPCKESYDLPLKNIGQQVALPPKRKIYSAAEIPQATNIHSNDLIFLNNLISLVLHSDSETALRSLLQVEQIFPRYEANKAAIIRSRLEALAWHPDEDIRVNAYRILISEDSGFMSSKSLPSFLNSGKSFINEKSVKQIAQSGFGKKQLEALRKRLHAYRMNLSWPADTATRKQFDNIFRLLLNFGISNQNFYTVIRAEFACWMLLKQEPELAKKAKVYLEELSKQFRENVNSTTPVYDSEQLRKKIVLDESIDMADGDELIAKLSDNHFLKQSVITTYDGHAFDLKNVPENGIWVSRVKSYRATKHYRMNIRTKTGKHFDIHIILDKKMNKPDGLEAMYRSIALAGNPQGYSVMTPFGCGRPKHGIASSRYLSELTAWEKIQSVAELQVAGYMEDTNVWRKIFIRSFDTFFRAWDQSGRGIIPGFISPGNVVLPENDFSENTKIVSVLGWTETDKIYPLISAMHRNFYVKTAAHYHSIKKHLNKSWMFHACVETFGEKTAVGILTKLKLELDEIDTKSKDDLEIYNKLVKYLDGFGSSIYLPLALFNAIDRYAHWLHKNKTARSKAKEQTIAELFELYKLDRYPDVVRFKFYRETYFFDSKQEILTSFDTLLLKMAGDVDITPLQLIELSDFRSLLTNEIDKRVFGKMVFPDIKEEQRVDLILSHNNKSGHVVVRSILKDKKEMEYIMREPMDPAEVGQLYLLFYKENYPKEISKMDRHFVVTDHNERVVAGLCYKVLEDSVVLIDGMAVTSPLHSRGLGSAMMDDFFTRMKAQNIKLIKAHFLFGNYYLKHNFKVDNKWGALVKEL